LCAYWDEEKPKKRTRLSKTAQYALKRATGNACIVCGKSEKEVGKLVYAHIVKPHSKGGALSLPMCAYWDEEKPKKKKEGFLFYYLSTRWRLNRLRMASLYMLARFFPCLGIRSRFFSRRFSRRSCLVSSSTGSLFIVLATCSPPYYRPLVSARLPFPRKTSLLAPAPS